MRLHFPAVLHHPAAGSAFCSIGTCGTDLQRTMARRRLSEPTLQTETASARLRLVQPAHLQPMTAPSTGNSLAHSLTHSLAHSLTHSLARSLDHSLARSLTHSLTRSLTRSLTHSLARSITRSLARSLAHSLTRSLARSLTHSLTHTRKPACPPARPPALVYTHTAMQQEGWASSIQG